MVQQETRNQRLVRPLFFVVNDLYLDTKKPENYLWLQEIHSIIMLRVPFICIKASSVFIVNIQHNITVYTVFLILSYNLPASILKIA